ncbi:MAG TPA: ATP-binding cassette domain-containing protein [Baekduia sp.]|uniref:ATP-binding cassette domain-containing protein n=1 Tax=Baekduia sp. TaxID=2600305 RepID=UPI002BF904EE|nr:ATP-binding cassette domain-containing protein [Baekduia sp.]HMJ36706.1 ATP-binding cassette domain-containing protein [Baekduia sp.]
MNAAPLLEIEGLVVRYRTGRRTPPVVACDGVDLSIDAGEIAGLVGESGSGKSTVAAAVLGLAPVAAGTIRFRGEDITHVSGARRRALAQHVQVVFQDPFGSLSPRRTVGQTLSEPLEVHRRLGRAERAARASAMLERVGLSATAVDRRPAELSGGQRQRVAIARALILEPELIVCDEALSALDLSVQAQVLNLLQELQRDLGVSYLFIAHDMAVVRHLARRVTVMRRGVVVERGDAQQLWDAPQHPYTRALLAAIPDPDPAAQRRRRQAREPGTTDDLPRAQAR